MKNCLADLSSAVAGALRGTTNTTTELRARRWRFFDDPASTTQVCFEKGSMY
jgi:hypothetical protein